MNEQFCSQCGFKLSEGDHFCPSCGKSISDMYSETGACSTKEHCNNSLTNKMNFLAALMIIYAAPAILLGAYLFIDATSLTDVLWNNAEFQQILIDMNISYDSLLESFKLTGIMTLVSGVFVAISFVVTLKRISWKIAVITCVIGSILAYSTIIGLVIGLVIAFMLYNARSYYKDYVPK